MFWFLDKKSVGQREPKQLRLKHKITQGFELVVEFILTQK